MTPLTPSLLAAATLLALSACQQGTPVREEPAADTTPTANTAATPPPTTANNTDVNGDTATQLPAAMQGRWGLVPADCEPGRADAKGLLVISPRRLEFYESAATLTDMSQSAPNRVRASFDFTGEGMSWQRDMTLAVGDDGRTLVRREFGDNAATEPLNYTKC